MRCRISAYDADVVTSVHAPCDLALNQLVYIPHDFLSCSLIAFYLF